MTATLNGHRVISARLVTPHTRVWWIDVDLDPDDVTLAPKSGPATLVLDTSPSFVGTVDPRGSDSFVAKSSVRLVAGGGGWDKLVPAQHFESPNGLLSSDVYSQTAKEVGETVVDGSPKNFPEHYPRMAGPASSIFRWSDWYVGFDGITRTGLRPPSVPDPSLEIMSFDPLEQTGELACDVVVIPGTVVTDSRIGAGAVTIRDIEQTWGPRGIRARFWTAGNQTTRLRSTMTQIAREAIDWPHLRTYRYRFVKDVARGMGLQAITPGAPDLNPMQQWTGLAGLSAKLAGTTLVIGFTADDPPQPYIASYLGSIPVETTIDASATAHVGPSAGSVQLAGTGNAVALGNKTFMELGKIATAIGALGGSYVPADPSSSKVSAGA